MFPTWELCGGKIHPRGFWKNISTSLMSEGTFVFYIHEASGKKQEESTEKTAGHLLCGKDVCSRYHHPLYLPPSSPTQNRKKEHRRAQDERSDQSSLSPVLKPVLQAKAFLWIPSMINWIWDWSLNCGLAWAFSNIRMGRQLKGLLGISLRKKKRTGTENVWKEWLGQKCSSHVL